MGWITVLFIKIIKFIVSLLKCDKIILDTNIFNKNGGNDGRKIEFNTKRRVRKNKEC